MTYENGSIDVSGCDCILFIAMQNAPMCAGHSMCALLAVFAPRSIVP